MKGGPGAVLALVVALAALGLQQRRVSDPHVRYDRFSLQEFLEERGVDLFRIAIEETEAFYLGDPRAIRAAFPEAKLRRMKDYQQDSICGTWELFQRVVDARSEDKVDWAERMASHLGTTWRGRGENRSPSFQQLCKGLFRLAGEPT